MQRDRQGHYGNDGRHLDGGLADMQGRVRRHARLTLLMLTCELCRDPPAPPFLQALAAMRRHPSRP
jgi:hypothetical protein